LSKSVLYKTYDNSPKVKQIADILQQTDSKIQLNGLIGSSLSFVMQSLFKKTEIRGVAEQSAAKPFLIILNDKEEAAYYLNDLEQMIGAEDVLFYPGSYRRPYHIEDTDNANVLLRAEVLNRINSRKKPAIIVTYPEALSKHFSRKSLQEKSWTKTL